MDALQELLDTPIVSSPKGHIKYYYDLIQHTDEWRQARCGLLTASEMKLIITPTLKIADNDKTRAHLYELAAQRITGHVPDSFQSFDMQRGIMDEMDAAKLYSQHHGKLKSCGFIVNEKLGFKLGYSPDGLLTDSDGQIETKSRMPKYQIETILTDEMPSEYTIQVQTGLLISERSFCDFNSYCGGLPMFTKRIYPDEKVQTAIKGAAEAAEEKIENMIAAYKTRIENDQTLLPTERRKEEIVI